jgi:hypothetical protein
MTSAIHPTALSSPAKAPPAWAARLRRINDLLLHDLGGGPRRLKLA